MVNDVTLRITLLMLLINNWDSHTIDVETDFFYSVLEGEVYTKIPEVMTELLEEYDTYGYILTLIKPIYCLVQAARCWFKDYIKTMTLKSGFKQCNTDPCLL